LSIEEKKEKKSKNKILKKLKKHGRKRRILLKERRISGIINIIIRLSKWMKCG